MTTALVGQVLVHSWPLYRLNIKFVENVPQLGEKTNFILFKNEGVIRMAQSVIHVPDQ